MGRSTPQLAVAFLLLLAGAYAATIITVGTQLSDSVPVGQYRYYEVNVPLNGAKLRQALYVAVDPIVPPSCAIAEPPCVYASETIVAPRSTNANWTACASPGGSTVLVVPGASSTSALDWIYIGVFGTATGACSGEVRYTITPQVALDLSRYRTSFPGRYFIESKVGEGETQFVTVNNWNTENKTMLLRAERCDLPRLSADTVDFLQLSLLVNFSTPGEVSGAGCAATGSGAAAPSLNGQLTQSMCPAAEVAFVPPPAESVLLRVHGQSWVRTYDSSQSSRFEVSAWIGPHMVLPSRTLSVVRSRDDLAIHLSPAQPAQFTSVVSYMVFSDMAMTASERRAAVLMGTDMLSSSCFLLSRRYLMYNVSVQTTMKTSSAVMRLAGFYKSDAWQSRALAGPPPRITVLAVDESGGFVYEPALIPLSLSDGGLADWLYVLFVVLIAMAVVALMMTGILLWRLTQPLRNDDSGYTDAQPLFLDNEN